MRHPHFVPGGYTRHEYCSTETLCIVSLTFILALCLMILAVVTRIVIIFLVGLWVLVQLGLFHIPFLPYFSKLIMSAAFTFSFAVGYLVFVVFSPPSVPAKPSQAGPGGDRLKGWQVYSQPCGNPVRCCVKELKVVHECMWDPERLACHNSAVVYWSCLVSNGMPREEHNIFVNGKHGRFMVNSNDLYVGASLALYGQWGEEEVEAVTGLVRAGDVAVDVGAYIAATTVALSRAVGARGTVHAFEPQRMVHQLAECNLALNSLTNVEIHRAGVGARVEDMLVPEVDPKRLFNFGVVGLHPVDSDRAGVGPAAVVPVVTIDSLQLERCDLIKIDAQGMEGVVLEGAQETLRRCKPALYVSYETSNRTLYQAMRAAGYECWLHSSPAFNASSYTAEPVNIFGSLRSYNALCLHQSRSDRPTAPPGLPGLVRFDRAALPSAFDPRPAPA